MERLEGNSMWFPNCDVVLSVQFQKGGLRELEIKLGFDDASPTHDA